MKNDNLQFFPDSESFEYLNTKKMYNTKYPVDTGRKLNVHKRFRRRPERFLDILCTFSLRLMSGVYLIKIRKQNLKILTAARLGKINHFSCQNVYASESMCDLAIKR